MRGDNLIPPVASWGRPIIQILASFPIAFFTGALVTDIIYAETGNVLWADSSDWMLAIGIILGAVAAIVGLLDLLVHRRARPWRRVGLLAIGCALVLIAALFDNLVHTRDAWTSVVPLGLVLSAVTVILTLITAWFGFAAPLTTAAPVITAAPIQSSRSEVRA